ncbi:hypothetical protein LCGC14_0141540 [marine sediment metagenome]|uniref:Uncharacterized protein n=1 Tax=marine sediment metagenome TaxID=412755 RepID=A0A0F9V4J9_9ZZZZ
MNVSEKEMLIDQIICKDISATILDRNDALISFVLHSPTPKEQAKAATVYLVEYQRAIISGLFNEEDTIKNMIILGDWSEQKETEIAGLYKDIHTIRSELLDLIFNTTKLERARSLLRRAETALLDRLSQRHTILNNSAESHAINCQQRYLISCITETEDGLLFWDTINDFEKFEDISIVTQLCEFFFTKSHLSSKKIRELARSQRWRMYWEVAKATNDLFDGSVSRWSWNQIELSYWSTIYDSVYEAYERPSRDIIVDDDLLDSWFIKQGEKSNNKTTVNTPSHSGKSGGRNEEFIMADKEGAKRVYNINDSNSRAKIQARQKILNRQGVVSDQNMPDSQMELRQQAVEKERQHIKSISSK